MQEASQQDQLIITMNTMASNHDSSVKLFLYIKYELLKNSMWSRILNQEND